METELHYRIYSTRNLCPSRVIWIQSTLQLYFLQIRFNIVLPATPSSFKWSLLITSHHQTPLCTSSVSHTCHMPRPSHSSWFNDPNNLWMRCSLCSLPQPLSPGPSDAQIYSSAPSSQTLSAFVSSWIWKTEIYTHEKQHAKLRFLYLVFAFLHWQRL